MWTCIKRDNWVGRKLKQKIIILLTKKSNVEFERYE